MRKNVHVVKCMSLKYNSGDLKNVYIHKTNNQIIVEHFHHLRKFTCVLFQSITITHKQLLFWSLSLWWATFKMGSKDSHLGIHTLVWSPALVYELCQVTCVPSEVRLWRDWRVFCSPSCTLSWSPSSGDWQLPWERPIRTSLYGKELMSLANSHQAPETCQQLHPVKLGAESAAVKPWDDCSPGQYLQAALRKSLNQRHPVKLCLDSCPSETEIIHTCFFKLIVLA